MYPKCTLLWELPVTGAVESTEGGHSAPPSTAVQVAHSTTTEDTITSWPA